MTKYTYTADDEYPDCGRCDNVNASDEFCIRLCGLDCGWNGYQRTIYEEEQDDAQANVIQASNRRIV